MLKELFAEEFNQVQRTASIVPRKACFNRNFQHEINFPWINPLMNYECDSVHPASRVAHVAGMEYEVGRL